MIRVSYNVSMLREHQSRHVKNNQFRYFAAQTDVFIDVNDLSSNFKSFNHLRYELTYLTLLPKQENGIKFSGKIDFKFKLFS